jgi:aspartate/methionine/tyrosine aminotransferase
MMLSEYKPFHCSRFLGTLAPTMTTASLQHIRGFLSSVFNNAIARRRDQFVRGLNGVPGFRCQPPEGAFYAWVEIKGTGLSAEELCRILLEDAGVAAVPGAVFGRAGQDFIRFSFAFSVVTLEEAVNRLRKVSSGWQTTTVID